MWVTTPGVQPTRCATAPTDTVSEEPYARYTRPGADGPDIGSYVKAVTDDARAWFEAQQELTRLEVAEKLGRLAAVAVLVVVIAAITMIVLMFLCVALALWLGGLLGSTILGFLLGGATFAVFGGIFHLLWRSVLRDRVTLAVINAIHARD